MRVGIEGNANVRMSHQILKGFRVHSSLCHIGAIGVAADMRRYLGDGNLECGIVFLANPLEEMLPMECDHRHTVLIQIQETALSIYGR